VVRVHERAARGKGACGDGLERHRRAQPVPERSEGARKALDSCLRAAGLSCRTFRDGEKRVVDAASKEMNESCIHISCPLHQETGDAPAADELQIATFNAVLDAQNAEGRCGSPG